MEEIPTEHKETAPKKAVRKYVCLYIEERRNLTSLGRWIGRGIQSAFIDTPIIIT